MASLLSLSDDALLEVLERIPLVKRHTVLALVCHRFRRLVNSSARLHATIDLCLRASIGPKPWLYYDYSQKKQMQQKHMLRPKQLARLSSLCVCLAQHAACSVCQLRLSVPDKGGRDPAQGRKTATAVEALVLQTSRPAGGITQGLTALALADHAAFSPKSALTVATLSSLRRLMLLCNRPLEWSLPAGGLPQLQQLSLEGDPLVVAPTAHFPPSLTGLWLSQDIGDSMLPLPRQVRGLTCLHTLGLHETKLEGDDMLPANLQRLMDCGELTLVCCTALEYLLLADTWHAGMQPGLANMRSLRSSAVTGTSDFQPGGPMLEVLERLMIETPAAISHASALGHPPANPGLG